MATGRSLGTCLTLLRRWPRAVSSPPTTTANAFPVGSPGPVSVVSHFAPHLRPHTSSLSQTPKNSPGGRPAS